MVNDSIFETNSLFAFQSMLRRVGGCKGHIQLHCVVCMWQMTWEEYVRMTYFHSRT